MADASDKSDSDSDSESGSGDDSSSSDEEEEKEEEKPKAAKRKADESVAAPEKKQKTEETEGESATLFVGRLSFNVDEDWLKREFEAIGPVDSCRIVTDRESGRSRGFGYVTFSDAASAQKAIDEYQGFEIDGRPVNLDFSNPAPKKENFRNQRADKFGDKLSEPSDTIFVGNLSFDADRDSLFEAFGEYGNVTSVRLPTNPETEQLKGFGYVQYGSVDEAKAAIEALNGLEIAGRPVRLDFSTPRDPSSGGGRGGRGGPRGGFGGRGGGRGGRGGPRGGFGGRGGRASGSNAVPFQGKKITF
ncbi:hypothetical protein BZA70DRAFT_234491 [Myxozyma melibiosi]|uniref:RRM domain-containing protein n=1 Tax=Myxozyma melibiosi TaxID=54550 RepID=A0ABR1FE58_9ASCO